MDDDEWITVEMRAEEEFRSTAAVRQEYHRGDGPPGYRIGRRVLFRRSEVERWRRAQRRSTTLNSA